MHKFRLDILRKVIRLAVAVQKKTESNDHSLSFRPQIAFTPKPNMDGI